MESAGISSKIRIRVLDDFLRSRASRVLCQKGKKAGESLSKAQGKRMPARGTCPSSRRNRRIPGRRRLPRASVFPGRPERGRTALAGEVPPAGPVKFDISVSRGRIGRLNAEGHEPSVRKAASAAASSFLRNKGSSRITIGGEDDDDRLGIPPVHVGRGQDERGGRVPARLDQDVGRRQAGSSRRMIRD